MINFPSICVIFAIFLITFCESATKENPTSSKYWQQQTNAFLQQQLNVQLNHKPAKNVILFLGDGMGLTVNTAGRIFTGQKDKRYSNQANLAWEAFPHGGVVKTHNVDRHVTDSASSATAYLTGAKAYDGVLGVQSNVQRADCSSSLKNPRTSIADWAMNDGKVAGFVTTTRVTHATPGALYSHTPDRNWECDNKIPFKSRNCPDIARQLIEGETGKRLKVMMGGGEMFFRPQGHARGGNRTDNRDLIQEWLGEDSQRKFVSTSDELSNLDISSTSQLLGLFNTDHLPYALNVSNDRTPPPSLADMTENAINILSHGDEGFFLLVEGGRIDHAMHRNQAKLGLEEVRQLHQAVERALSLVDTDDTLIITTADHSHSMSLIGNAPRSVSVTGKFTRDESEQFPVSDVLDGATTMLVFANGPGSVQYQNLNANAQRRNLTFVDTEVNDFTFPAWMPATDESHDVGIWAIGPYSHLFTGTIDNTFIARTMAFVLCVNEKEYMLNACNAKENGYEAQYRSRYTTVEYVLLAIVICIILAILILLIALLILQCKRSHTSQKVFNSGIDLQDVTSSRS